MPTPKDGYYNSDGKRLLRTTTVIKPYNPEGSEGLVKWMVDHRLAGRDPDAERDRAAAIGTMAHKAIEWWAKGGVFAFTGPPEITEPAEMAYSGFIEWSEGSKFQITHTEVRLTSKHGYGGTIDVVGYNRKGLRSLGDWKTSNRLYGTMLMQVAAYKNLWDENFPDDPITGGLNLLRFDKNTGSFTHKWYPELDNEWESFLLLLKLYERYKETRKKL